MGDGPIVHVPAPWKLKGTMYIVNFYCKRGNLPDYAYSPLEKESSFAGAESGTHVGGVGQFHFIRYTETPVGPYDELVVIPGNFQYDVEEDGRRKAKKNVRITRIYVSQKQTCWNGRHNWNIPKHLARFEWEESPHGPTRVKVFPHDLVCSSSTETSSDRPFFQATFQPISFIPHFPFSFSWIKYVGLDPALVQPPLPKGEGFEGELAGTGQWSKVEPDLSSKNASLGWADMSQGNGSIAPSSEPTVAENFWPGIGRWQLAVRLEDATFILNEGTQWDAPRSNL